VQISKHIKEEYVRLIVEKTERYDLSLVLARDKLVAHGSKYGIGITANKEGGIRINKENIFADFNNEANQLIAIKKKYESNYTELKNVHDNLFNYTELKNVHDNLWQIMDFFMNYDIQLEENDKSAFIDIVSKTGGLFTDIIFCRHIRNFIEEFDRIFG
jgi:hypothetical protein